MNSITTVILAHGDAIETIKRHLPIWKAYTDNLLFVSPKDNPLVLEGYDCLSIEKREHHGIHALKRHLFAMKVALNYKSDFYVFLEYDAIMLKRLKPRPIIQGNLFNEKIFLNKDEEAMRQGLCFLHFPWIFPADKLKEFVDKVDLSVENHPSYSKRYAHDIWLIQKLMKLNFEVFNLLGSEGFSNNSFDTPERLSKAISAVEKKAYALHGIKTEDVLKQILKAANQEQFLL
jgi:hypothetical protein